MEYLCYYCESVFPADTAIDGYKEGYKVGFLCPCCGENIQDHPLREEWHTDSTFNAYYSVFIGYILLVWFVLDFVLVEVEWLYYGFAGMGLIILVIYGLVKHPKEMVSPVLKTQPVQKNN